MLKEVIERMIEEMGEQIPTSFSEDIKIDNEVIGRIHGLFTEEGIICLLGFTILSPEIKHIRIINEEGAVMASLDVSSVSTDVNDTVYFNDIPLISRKFIIEVMKSGNEKITFKVDKRGEVLKEVIKGAIKDVAGKKPVAVIVQKE